LPIIIAKNILIAPLNVNMQ